MRNSQLRVFRSVLLLSALALFALTALRPAQAARPSEHFITEDIAQEARKYVVNIQTLSTRLGEVDLQSQMQRVTRQYVSGVIMRENGYIVTVGDMVEDADSVRVYLDDSIAEKYTTKEERREGLFGEIVHVDEQYNLAIIKIDKEGLPVPEFAPVNTVDQGDLAVVIGNSAGYGSSVISGIVSGIRNITTEEGAFLPDSIQTDASANPGTEGGGMFNWKGQLMGIHIINTGLQDTNFFMNPGVLRQLTDKLISTKEDAMVPYLGIVPWIKIIEAGAGGQTGAGQIPNSLRMQLGLPDQYWDQGILVDDLITDSPASVFGLQQGDFLVNMTYTLNKGTPQAQTFEDQPLRSTGQLQRIMYFMNEDQVITFGVIRDRTFTEVSIPVQDLPDEHQSLVGKRTTDGEPVI